MWLPWDPSYYLSCFMLALILFRVPMDSARDHGWLLPKDTITDTTDAFTSILHLFTRLNPKNINLKGFYSLLTTIISMSLFGLLHLPINIPSFARSTNNSFCMHQDYWHIVMPILLPALLGFIPGYFVYSNSVLFFKIGARGRMTSVALSLATLCLLFSINIASFIPVIMVTN